MIFYVACYPRSGSAWTRQTLEHCFGRVVTGTHASTQQHQSYIDSLLTKGGFTIHDEDSGVLCLLSPYQQKTYLLKDPAKLSDKSFRMDIAADSREIFVKSHSPAMGGYLLGESIIFLVRHPAASLSSYQRFFQHFRGKNFSVRDILTSIAPAVSGPFAGYVKSYLSTLPTFPHLIIRYEDKTLDYHRTLKALGQFIKAEPVTNSQPNPLDYPVYAEGHKQIVIAKMSSWMGNLTTEDMQAIHLHCAEQMEVFHYRFPTKNDYEVWQQTGDVCLADPLIDTPSLHFA